MTTFTDKELIKEIKERIGSLDVRDNIERRAYEIALASLEADPVKRVNSDQMRRVCLEANRHLDKYDAMAKEVNKLLGRIAPPAPVVPDDWQLVPKKITLEMECALSKADSYEIGWLWALAAAPKYEVQNAKRMQNALNACRAAMRKAGNSPVTQDGLSTVCAEAYQVVGVMADALGVFGDAAVQKVLDNLSQQKLVHRDVLPFSLPVTQDGWISCSERMPEKNQNVLISVNFDSSLVEPLICSARYTGSTFRRGDATIKPGNGIEQATHWMPLPEPPQETK